MQILEISQELRRKFNIVNATHSPRGMGGLGTGRRREGEVGGNLFIVKSNRRHSAHLLAAAPLYRCRHHLHHHHHHQHDLIIIVTVVITYIIIVKEDMNIQQRIRPPRPDLN